MGFGWSGIGAFLTGDDVAGATASTIGSDADVFGSRPDVADYTPINLSDEFGRTTQANLDNADSLMAMMDRLIPGFSSIVRQGMDTSASLMRGEIPQDVQDQITRGSAYQSLMGGFAGSGMSRALTARDLGRTSLDLTQMGANSAQMWAKLAETSYDPFIIKTMQQAGTTAANNAGAQAVQQAHFNVAAAPDPAAAAKFAIDSAIGMKMMDWGLGLAGGMMGGGGGQQQQQQQPQQQSYWMPSNGQSSQSNAASAWGSSGSSFTYNPSSGQYEYGGGAG